MQLLTIHNALYRQIPINGVHMGVLEYPSTATFASEESALILLHGFMGSARSWEPQLVALAQLGIRVIALDMLGHGLSSAPDDPARYSIERCQEDIIGILTTLGLAPGQAILLGYSMGGRIALYSAFSGYFRALILESASPGLPTPQERSQRHDSDERQAAFIEQYGVEAFVDTWEQLPLFASQRQLAPERWQGQRAQRLNNRAHGLAQSLRGLGTGAQPALHARLPELKLPTLLITGALDQKFCAIAQNMQAHIPCAQWQTVPAAGHAVHLEQPAAFIHQVTQFCATML